MLQSFARLVATFTARYGEPTATRTEEIQGAESETLEWDGETVSIRLQRYGTVD